MLRPGDAEKRFKHRPDTSGYLSAVKPAFNCILAKKGVSSVVLGDTVLVYVPQAYG